MKQCMRCSLHKLLWAIDHCEFLVFVANDIQASYTAQFKYIHFGLVLLCYLIFLNSIYRFFRQATTTGFLQRCNGESWYYIRILFIIFVILFRSYDLRMHCLCYISGNFRYLFINKKNIVLATS